MRYRRRLACIWRNMLLAAARDIASMFVLDALLSRLREEYLEKVLEGSPPADDFWPAGEQAAVEELKRRFYNQQAREAVKPGEAEEIDDQKDFDTHGQKLIEHAIWMTHALLKQTPFVGQEEYRED
jgi:hypothetical protein